MWDKILIVLAIFMLLFKYNDKVYFVIRKIKFYFKMFIYYFYSSLICSFGLAFLMWRPNNDGNGAILGSILKQVTKVYGLEWHLRNGDILAEDRGAVVVSNHQSSLDVLAIFNIWEVVRKLAPVCKKQLKYTGPFALAAYLCGAIFIDRSDSTNSYKQLECANSKLQNKYKLWFYPEGRRNMNGKVLPFKKGAFNVAVAAQVPIIPVVKSPYYFIDEKKHIFNNGGHIIIKCLEPVPTVGLTKDDVPALADRVYEMMSHTFEELKKEVYANIE